MDAHRQECLCHVAQPFLPVSVSGVSEHQPQAELDVTVLGGGPADAPERSSSQPLRCRA